MEYNQGSPQHSMLASNTLFEEDNPWYAPALAGAKTLAKFLFSRSVYVQTHRVLKGLTPDRYSTFLSAFLKAGSDRYGSNWRYADICTVLSVLSRHLQIDNYLEIGVRRGRSMAMAAFQRPQAHIVGFDLWQQGYAGMENPGPDFVMNELQRVGFTGDLELISGDSHLTVPEYFSAHPDKWFDLVTVDGDHSEEGARADLETVIPRLKVGGALVFDDIVHPQHRYLMNVWRDCVEARDDFSTFAFTELGYGVAFGIRMA